jgi:hypothetical protein
MKGDAYRAVPRLYKAAPNLARSPTLDAAGRS